MAELADALDSGSNSCKAVQVQVLLPAPKITLIVKWVLFFLWKSGLEPEKVWAKRKQFGELFSAKSGETGTECEALGRRAKSMRSIRSSPVTRTKIRQSSDCLIFIHCESNGISSAEGAYHHRRWISFRNDEIQNYVLMICNFCEIDYMHSVAVIMTLTYRWELFSKKYCIFANCCAILIMPN